MISDGISISAEELRQMTSLEVLKRFGLEDLMQPERITLVTPAPRPLEPTPLTRTMRLGCAVLAVALLPFWLVAKAVGEEERR